MSTEQQLRETTAKPCGTSAAIRGFMHITISAFPTIESALLAHVSGGCQPKQCQPQQCQPQQCQPPEPAPTQPTPEEPASPIQTTMQSMTSIAYNISVTGYGQPTTTTSRS